MKNSAYNEVIKKFGLTNERLAQMFGYKSVNSWANSTRKEKLRKGVTELIEHVSQNIIDRIK